MRHISCIFILFLFFGCAKSISKEELSNLNGYWEIEKVVFPDGSQKEYSGNTLIDFFKLEGFNGFRKKVQPKFDGTYDTSNDAEQLKIIEVEGNFKLQYRNNMSEWSETLKSLHKNTFVLVNEAGVAYHYKRFKSIGRTEK